MRPVKLRSILGFVRLRLFLFLIASAIFFPSLVAATLGVGVGTGKIEVKDKLKPGVIYELPPLTVLNTGTETADYGVDVAYHEKQTQLRPPKNWFEFSPETFRLEPAKAQIVKIRLDLPLKAEPGDYFAYLEGHPIRAAKNGNTSIGVAAAAKLYFTVVPANLGQAVFYKAASLWKIYSPWPQRFLLLLAAGGAYLIAKRYFNIQIGLRKTGEENGKKNKDKGEPIQGGDE